jgi:hypothetical protein
MSNDHCTDMPADLGQIESDAVDLNVDSLYTLAKSFQKGSETVVTELAGKYGHQPKQRLRVNCGLCGFAHIGHGRTYLRLNSEL